MQRDISSFFKPIIKSNAAEIAKTQKIATAKKRKAFTLSNDEDDDDVNVTKSTAASKREGTSAKLHKKPMLEKLKASPKKELKKVNPLDLFRGEAKRVETKKPPKPKKAEIIDLDDDAVNQSLLEIDLDASISESKNNKKLEKTPKKEKDKDIEKTPKSSKESYQEKNKPKSADSKERKSRRSDATNGSSPIAKRQKQESPAKKPIVTPPAKKPKSTPRAKKQEATTLETSVLSDEERNERKRVTAILYQKFKNRSSCLNPGSKEVPKGKPDCLQGLTFLVTGILESLERDEANAIIKEHGGRVMTVVGKKLNYLVVGEEAGPKKLAQAEEYNITTISEDGLFQLIRERSGENQKIEQAKPNKSPKELKAAMVNSSSSKNAKEKKQDQKSPAAKEAVKAAEIKEETKFKKEKQSPKEKVRAFKEETNFISTASAPKVPDDMLAWVDKYKPETIKDIIGQQGAASNVVKLTNWLTKWYINHNGKQKPQRPNPWAKNDDGSYFKAALLSGPPGVGKTTTATLVCKELGFDTVEFNASDTRSKNLLKEEVATLLSCKSLYGFFHGNSNGVTKKHVLIMDEVDGMAGNEDRGGVQELIALIKASSVPIICMCNDRNHPKIRSLASYAFDLRFNKPRLEQIKGRMLSICFKENIKIEPAKLEEIIVSTNNDIRQTINHIALLSAGKKLNLGTENTKTAEKDLKIGPWEVVRKVFSAEEHKKMSLYDKADLFFHDYSIAPLFVQQNYLLVVPEAPRTEHLKRVAAAADALSLGDLIDKQIRSNNAWSLLPTQAFFSSVIPGEQMCGRISAAINFPSWLGKNSRTNKLSRLAQELHDHTRIRTSGSRESMRLDYAQHLLARITKPLIEYGNEGVEDSVNFLREYHLLREDIDSLVELTTWRGKKTPLDAVDGRVKAALTRAYNKEGLAYCYSGQAAVKKKKTDALTDEQLLEAVVDEEGVDAEPESDNEKDDDLLNDGLIKAKKKPATTKATTSKAATGTKKSTAGANRKEKTSAKTKK